MSQMILNQSVLAITLGILVVILAYLLISRVRLDRIRARTLGSNDPESFLTLIEPHGLGGSIQAVAGKVSELLKSSYGCDRIVFLRKQRAFFEMNYYHGIRRFNRNDFRLKYSPELTKVMRRDFAPRAVEVLVDQVPDLALARLREHDLGLFFPIFWGENLYGIYFVRSERLRTTPSLIAQVGVMARLLSVAYHNRWHEARYEKLARRTQENRSSANSENSGSPGHWVLKLVRHRELETLIPKLMEAVQSELRTTKLVYLYQGVDGSLPTLSIRSGVASNIDVELPIPLKDLTRLLGNTGVTGIERIEGERPEISAWASRLEAAGLRFATSFPVSESRTGVLVFSSDRPDHELRSCLEQFRASMRELYSNAELFGQMEELSYTDSLTGLFNQRYFHKRLTEEIDRARRYGRSLALIMFDLDQLKAINDRLGHQAGDAMLKQMGETLRSSVRAIDVIARYGGDEFCIIMPEADTGTCSRFMQRFHSRISSSRYVIPGVDERLNCTISLGGAVFPEHATSPEKLIFAADMAMLNAKESGRDTYVLYDSLLQAQ